MKYVVYQVTCKVNGKSYIGKHQTENLDDGYMGSGKLLRRAIKKHGVENFERTILHVFNDEESMNLKEAEIVTKEFCARDDNYNLCPGGQGGWGYVNQTLPRDAYVRAGRKGAKNQNSKVAFAQCQRANARHPAFHRGAKTAARFAGKQHSLETRLKMSNSQRGKHVGINNSQYGLMWITNGKENRKIKKTETIPTGFVKGRT